MPSKLTNCDSAEPRRDCSMKSFRSDSDWRSDTECWWRPRGIKAYLRESELRINLYLVILFLAWVCCGLVWTAFSRNSGKTSSHAVPTQQTNAPSKTQDISPAPPIL